MDCTSPREVPSFLVLSASYGGGHQRVAEVLEAAWRRSLPRVEVELVDFFDRFVNPVMNRLTRSLYVRSVRHAPRLWGAFYDATGHIRPDSPTQRFINRLGKSRLLAYLRERDFHVVVSVHPTPAGSLSELKGEGKVHHPSAVVLTDYAVHSQWIHPYVDLYCVASEEVRAGLVDRGVPADRIRVTGIPVDPAFAQPVDRGEVARRLGLDPSRTTVLVMAGAYAMLGGILDVHRVLLTLRKPVQAVFVCGRDHALVQRLRQRSRRRPDFHVHGFVSNVHEWMAAADLLITKAGGITVSEALVRELPMVIYRPIPGQEEWNTRMLAAAGAAWVARDPEDLRRALDRLLADPGALESMRAAARRVRRPHAAREAAEAIAGLLPEACRGAH
ncbi:MAG: glycosyltransferase [Armatimonadota bacterium]|nr:UDP-N-acetylglucosamine 2-epimerase [Armatimonadota bacterium]MDW8156113.1 glycosyltransferase [Armatimonadota bacterium]